MFYAAVHSTYSISGIQKFTYLKAPLQGDAARAIDTLPPSDQNYQHYIELLQDRFGQPHKLIDAHMKAFMYMASPTVFPVYACSTTSLKVIFVGSDLLAGVNLHMETCS